VEYVNLILCGFPKCGKSTVGKELAALLQWEFIDTDEKIENAYFAATAEKKTCRDIYLDDGEEAFRYLEKFIINDLKHVKKTVIAIGGGSLNDPENVTFLRQIGKCIFLKTDESVLLKRLLENQVPAYLDPNDTEASAKRLFFERSSLYHDACDLVVEADSHSESEIAQLIADKIHIGHV